MRHVYAGKEITYDLTQRSRGHLYRAADAEEGNQLIDVKWNCLLYQQKPASRILENPPVLSHSAVDGSDDGDVDDWAKKLCF